MANTSAMGSDKRTKIEEISVVILFLIMLALSICFSLKDIKATESGQQISPTHTEKPAG